MKVEVLLNQKFVVEFDESNSDLYNIVINYKNSYRNNNYDDIAIDIVQQVCNQIYSPNDIGEIMINNEGVYDSAGNELIHPINVICDNMTPGWIKFNCYANIIEE